MNPMRRWLFCGLALVVMPAVAQQEVPVASLDQRQSGKIWFLSVEKSSSAFAIAEGKAKLADPIFGLLEFPVKATGKVPAIVIAHSSAGVSAHDHDWAARLREIGLATFIVDSFSPRGVGPTMRDQSTINTTVNAADALVALKLLSTHPAIDSARIAVIGWSRGGIVAIRTKLDPLRRSLAGDANRFAAHVALYPFCESTVWSESMTPAPALVIVGELDQYTAAGACRTLVERMNARGANIRFEQIVGAHHGFDENQSAQWVGTIDSYSKCFIEQNVDDSTFVRLDTGKPMTPNEVPGYLNSCRSMVGVNVGATAGSRERSIGEVTEFLKRTLFRGQ